MGVYQNEEVRVIEIEIPSDPAGGLGVIVREKHGKLLPGAGKSGQGDGSC